MTRRICSLLLISTCAILSGCATKEHACTSVQTRPQREDYAVYNALLEAMSGNPTRGCLNMVSVTASLPTCERPLLKGFNLGTGLEDSTIDQLTASFI